MDSSRIQHPPQIKSRYELDTQEEGSDEEEDTPEDDDQVAFAAHAAAQALSDNDNAGAAVLEDDVDVDALAKAVDGGSEDEDDESSGYDQQQQQQQQQHIPHPGAQEVHAQGNGYASSLLHQQHISGFPPSSLIKQTQESSGLPSPAIMVNGFQHNYHQHSSLPAPEIIEHPICCICGQGNEEGRPILRFLPVMRDSGAARAAPAVVSFGQDILLHIFCGKTASILPTVNRPDLEILTKAGLKNKHGIGPEVNAALARTRSAIVLVVEPDEEEEEERKNNVKSSSSVSSAASNKDKQYYLVREFEAHLAAIRHTHLAFDGTAAAVAPVVPAVVVDPFVPPPDLAAALGDAPYDDGMGDVTGMEYAIPQPEAPKIPPIKARAGQVHKASKRYNAAPPQQPPPVAAPAIGPSLLEQQHDLLIPYGAELLADGKIKCPCGGTHLPPTQQRGAQSWRNHIMTKRHQKWMEEHGLVGAV